MFVKTRGNDVVNPTAQGKPVVLWIVEAGRQSRACQSCFQTAFEAVVKSQVLRGDRRTNKLLKDACRILHLLTSLDWTGNALNALRSPGGFFNFAAIGRGPGPFMRHKDATTEEEGRLSVCGAPGERSLCLCLCCVSETPRRLLICRTVSRYFVPLREKSNAPWTRCRLGPSQG